jgi:sialic acid synthase SpsE
MTAAMHWKNRRWDGTQPPYVIAEVGVNHDGDLGVARDCIQAAAAAGVDAVKFQTFLTTEFMADRDLKYTYETASGQVTESMHAMFERLQMPTEWHVVLQNEAAKCNVDFLSSSADRAAVDLLVNLDVPVLKLASEDLINRPLLEYVAQCDRAVLLSTGMADELEIREAVQVLSASGCPRLILLHCVSIYPTPDAQANLNRITALHERFSVPVGWSDHTVGVDAALASTALGAIVIEKHFTLDRRRLGPDHLWSADPAEMSQLVLGVRRVHQQLGRSSCDPADGELTLRNDYRRSIVAARPIAEGECIDRAALCLKRPGTGLHPRHLAALTGRTARVAFSVDEQLHWEGIA